MTKDTREPHRYQQRRAEAAAAMVPDGMGIWMSPPQIEQRPDVGYPFVQQPGLMYLTGCDEPETILILRNNGHQSYSAMFIRPKDDLHERWDGARPTPAECKQRYGVDDVWTLDALDEKISEWAAQSQRIYYETSQWEEQNRRVQGWMVAAQKQTRRGQTRPSSMACAGVLLEALRSRKDDAELIAMRRAAAITTEAFARVRDEAEAGVWAYQLEAALLHTFHGHGGSQAFSSIVASGDRATVLHSQDRAYQLQEGELLLIDAGARWGGYAADCSRVFPVGGRFSQAQADLYDLVLKAQEAALACCRPGKRFNEVEDAARDVLQRGLIALSILPSQESDESPQLKDYFPHRIGHWLGLDVHDPGDYTEGDGSARLLQPGMCLTVEPGLYIPATDTAAPASYRGIGIRIEDAVVITDDAPEILTAACPKDRQSLERASAT